MHHAVPPPALPPDPDDLYAPPDPVGAVARSVWQSLRLISTNTDFAWCTVCRRWLRYCPAFHVAHIKDLYRHCRDHHVRAPDGSLHPRPSSSSAQQQQPQQSHPPQPQPSPPPLPPPPQQQQPQQQQQQQQRRLSLQQAQIIQQAQLEHDKNIRLHAALATEHRRLREKQRRIQAAALQLQKQEALQRQNLQRQLAAANPQLPLQHPHPQPQQLPQPQQQLPPNVSPDLAHRFTELRAAEYRDPARAALPTAPAASASAPSPAVVPATPVVSRPVPVSSPIAKPNRTSAQHLAALEKVLAKPANTPPALSPAAVAVSAQMASQLPPVAPSPATASAATATTPAYETDGDARMTPDVPAVSPPAASTPAAAAVATAAIPPLPSSASAPTARPQPSSAATPTARTSSSAAPRAGPQSRSAPGASRPAVQAVTRCECPPQVRKVAERSQNLMFKGMHMFFSQATFKVPSTEDEAMQVMRTGTYDVDNDDNPDNDLYFISWSHTQFFAAQMAALGYRFLASNLRRKAAQDKPPPVEKWLVLQKYHYVARPRMRNALAAAAPAQTQRRASSAPGMPPLSSVTPNGAGATTGNGAVTTSTPTESALAAVAPTTRTWTAGTPATSTPTTSIPSTATVGRPLQRQASVHTAAALTTPVQQPPLRKELILKQLMAAKQRKSSQENSSSTVKQTPTVPQPFSASTRPVPRPTVKPNQASLMHATPATTAASAAQLASLSSKSQTVNAAAGVSGPQTAPPKAPVVIETVDKKPFSPVPVTPTSDPASSATPVASPRQRPSVSEGTPILAGQDNAAAQATRTVSSATTHVANGTAGDQRAGNGSLDIAASAQPASSPAFSSSGRKATPKAKEIPIIDLT